MPIDDAIALMSRCDRATWESEMLCIRPGRRDAVYPEFDAARHVREFEPPAGAMRLAGMDFGFRSPAVVLWAAVDEAGVLSVFDERIVSGVVLEGHARAIAESRWGPPEWIGVDPAGRARNEHTGRSSVQVLRDAGLRVRSRTSGVEEGLRLVRARLAPADGAPPRLFIHPRCEGLIDALTRYRYDKEGDEARPIKDGADHACDALRYLVVNFDAPYRTTLHSYP